METKRTINAFERALLFFSRFFTAVSDVFDISEQIENNFMSYMLIDWKSLFTETSSQVANSRILHIAPCRYIYVYSPTGVIYAWQVFCFFHGNPRMKIPSDVWRVNKYSLRG